MEKKKSIFTRLFARQKENEVEVVEEPIDEASAPTVAETIPHTVLVFTPEQEEKYSEDMKKELYKKLNELPPLPLGEVNVAPLEAGTFAGGYYVRVFVRNASKLEEDFELTELPLFLIDASGEVVASGMFRPQNFGTLRFGESRYWAFAWSPAQVRKRDADFSSFTVAFDEQNM